MNRKTPYHWLFVWFSRAPHCRKLDWKVGQLDIGEMDDHEANSIGTDRACVIDAMTPPPLPIIVTSTSTSTETGGIANPAYQLELLRGRVAIITGGAQGIGAAIAELFAKNGALVNIFDKDEEQSKKFEERLAQSGIKIWIHLVDITHDDKLAEHVRLVISIHARIDILVNNAAQLGRIPFERITEADWDLTYLTNLKALYSLCQLILPGMRERQYGKIVNISSITFLLGAVDCVHYNTTKEGMIGFSRSLAREYGLFNINVNCITPGAIMTARELTVATPASVASHVER